MEFGSYEEYLVHLCRSIRLTSYRGQEDLVEERLPRDRKSLHCQTAKVDLIIHTACARLDGMHLPGVEQTDRVRQAVRLLQSCLISAQDRVGISLRYASPESDWINQGSGLLRELMNGARDVQRRLESTEEN